MLKLQNIHTFYGPIEALRGINLTIEKGEIVCLIGGNGAGKSTALMTISGILRPSEGEIFYEGVSIKDMPPHRISKMGISHVPEGRRIFPRLTVLENLQMGAFQKGKVAETLKEKVFELFPVLEVKEKQMGGTLSGGEQQMLAIGRALMSRPSLLLLDEPSLGLAPILVSRIFKTIKEINAEGVTVLLVEQNAKAALKFSARGYVLEGGSVSIEGTGDELLRNENVKRAYLGE